MIVAGGMNLLELAIETTDVILHGDDAVGLGRAVD
jgi:hypothetical protein